MKTKVTNAIILISVLFFIPFVLGGCKKKVTIGEVLLEYMAYIPQQEYEAMYKMIDVKASGSIEKDKFIERNSKIYEGIEISNFEVEVLEVNEKELTVTYTTSFDTLSDKITFENTANFVEAEEGHKLIWKDSLIVPNLESTDKVSVSVNKAVRGKILDRNEYVLAGQGEAFAVGLVPEKIEDDENTFAKLAGILGVDVDTIRKKLDAKWVRADLFVPIKLLSMEDKEQYKEELLSIPGVMIKTQIVRSYPLGEVAAHLVGYVQNVTAEDLEEHWGEGYSADSVIGRSGMEALYEKELKGKNGYSIEILGVDGKRKEILAYNDVEHGKDIKLTIDCFLQQDLYEAFKEDKSCSVALNPETGEVLALVSTPTYDNNDFILGMSTAKWDALNNDERKPLLNRFRQTYAPGSTFKPITASIGLQNNVFTADEDFGSEGYEWQKDESFAKALNILGFNEKLPFEITMGKSKYSNTEQIETEIQLADSGYGQGQIMVNPLHLATLYTAFVNQGDVLKPTLRYEENYNSKVWIEKAFSKDVANTVLEGIKLVINNPNGTGYVAHNDNVVLAGKTGTAEIKSSQNDTSGTELGWFVVTTTGDTDKPIMLVSMVEDVKNIGGSSYVAKKDAQVLNKWFK